MLFCEFGGRGSSSFCFDSSLPSFLGNVLQAHYGFNVVTTAVAILPFSSLPAQYVSYVSSSLILLCALIVHCLCSRYA